MPSCPSGRWKRPKAVQPSRPSVNEWLPSRNECCGLATVGEHLASVGAGSCLRRFLATPLHEMIFRRRNGRKPPAKARGTDQGLPGSSMDGRLEETGCYGRQDEHQEQASKPSCDGGPGARATPLLPLRDGAHHRADSPTAGWGCLLLE